MAYALIDRERGRRILEHYGCRFDAMLADGSEGWLAPDGYAFVVNLDHGEVYDEMMLRQVLTMTLGVTPPAKWPA